MRPGSPPFGFSTLTTSAPSWAKTSVQVGPASNCDKSSTRTPARQFGAAAASVIGQLLRYGLAKNSAFAAAPAMISTRGQGFNRILDHRHPGEGRDPHIRAREANQWV